MKKIFKILSAMLIVCFVLSVAASCAANEYVLTITENGNTYTTVIKVGDSYTLKNPDEREGYNFVGWYSDGKLLKSTFTPTSDMKIEGVWERFDKLAEELKISLKEYLSSDNFKNAAENAKTAEARLPLLYLRYVKGDFYNDNAKAQIKKYLDMIEEIIEDGAISDAAFISSEAGRQGWYGVPDYLYSWSAIYNQYLDSRSLSETPSTEYSKYDIMIKDYLKYVDSFYSDALYTFGNEEIALSEILTKGNNCVNNFTNDSYRLEYEVMRDILGVIYSATGKDSGHAEFLSTYERAFAEYADMTKDMRNEMKAKLKTLWYSCVPNTKVAWGYDIESVLTITAYNLGLPLSDTVENSEKYMLSYYDKDVDGNWIKDGGTANWVGFSGRPLAGSIFRNHEKYDVAYEKTMQGYFPFTDGWDQPLEEMINMDRLCNFYNSDLNTGASAEPFYGLLYGFMNGVDMEHYVKEVYHLEICVGEGCKYHIDEEVGQVYNVITLWRDTLKKDSEGRYVIDNTSDMAVAIAYCAMVYGVEAPSPLGLYNSADKVVDIG